MTEFLASLNNVLDRIVEDNGAEPATGSATVVMQAPAQVSEQMGENGEPVKRGRGRPRLTEEEKAARAAARAAAAQNGEPVSATDDDGEEIEDGEDGAEGEVGANETALPARVTAAGAPVAAPRPTPAPPQAAPAPVATQAPTQEAIAVGPETDAGRALAALVVPSILPIIAAEVSRATGNIRPTVIQIPGRKEIRFEERTHDLFAKALKLVQQGLNVMLVGPAGCGKTFLAEQIAKAMGMSFSSISCSPGLSESQITGRLLPVGDGGKFQYVGTPFTKRYTEGGVFLFDEIDAADPSVALCVNTAIANGHMEIEQRAASDLDTRVDRHKDSVIIASANTYGTGANAQYVGRAPLDAATLDRFTVLSMDYDAGLEKGMGDEDVVAWVHGLRRKAAETNLRRVVSTRMIQKFQGMRAAGLTDRECKEILLAGWKPEERTKVGA